MIKKTISYTSPFDETRVITKDYYFSLTKVEILEFASRGDDFEQRLLRIVAAKDLSAVFVEFRAIITMALGMKDGDELVKDPTFTAKFMASPAFDQLVQDLFGSDDQGASFFQGMLPRDMQKEAAKQQKRDSVTGATNEKEFEQSVNPFADEPAWIREQRIPTQQEFNAATDDQKKLAFSRQLGVQG
jgi:hypothetical protein